MKVLHCITSTGVGGAQVMLLRYLRALGARGQDHAVLSLMPNGQIGEEIAALGIHVHSVDMCRGSWSPVGLLRARQLVRESHSDIVHGWMYHGNLAAQLAVLGAGHAPAVVWAVHHSLQDLRNESLASRAVIRASARLSHGAAGISYCSSVAARQHECQGFAANRSSVIPNGIDTDAFRPDPEARSRLGALADIPAGRTIIGTVGRDHPMKDQARMVAAIARLISEGHDVHAVLVGAGQQNGRARRAANELGIEDRVTTLAERRDIAKIVAGFDVFLLPSAWGEAFPLAVCEAMASGVPVIVTDVGDSRRIVGDNGLVVSPGNTDSQAAGMARLINLDPIERRGLGTAGRARICKNFSMSRYVDSHDALYSMALDRRDVWPANRQARQSTETAAETQ